MENSNDSQSRIDRRKKRRSDKMLNWLIGAVVVGILIVGWSVLSPNEEEQAEEEPPTHEEDDDTAQNQEDEQIADEVEEPENEASEEIDADEIKEDEVEIIKNPEESYVSESIIDPAWEPIGTVQTGEHVSLYDGASDDWKEKQQALLYATGLTEDNIIYKRVKNGGSPEKSIGIVTSLDATEKYRVYLEWVDGEGWKPTQLDVLNTLEFDY